MQATSTRQSGYMMPPPMIQPRNSVHLQRYSAQQPSSSSSAGTIRAAALAARKAHHVQQKRMNAGSSMEARHVSFQSVGPPAPVPIARKKNLKLQLNLDTIVEKNPMRMSEPAPVMAPIPQVSFEPLEIEPSATFGWNDGSQVTYSTLSNADITTTQPCGRVRRRKSSITVSLRSPEAADFQEFAQDGPMELGKGTKKVKRLGKGAGGTVYLSLYLPILKLVAVKEVLVFRDEERRMVKHELHALHENLTPLDMLDDNASDHSNSSNGSGKSKSVNVGLWNGMKHHFSSIGRPQNCPYLVSFYGAYLTPSKSTISIVMEFMDMGSLQNILDDKITIPEVVLKHCAYCCLTALDHMHRQRMVHRDIKPANILLNRRGDFKVADFGLAGTLSKSASFFSEFEGTMMYMAPERITGKNYTCSSDIWSMGIVLFSLARGSYPFEVDDGFFGLEEAICTDPLPPMPVTFSPECRDFIKGLLRRDPNTRLSAAQALTHPFLKRYGESVQCQNFGYIWQHMPLSSAIKQEDVKKIASMVVDYSKRYPDLVSVPMDSLRYQQQGERHSKKLSSNAKDIHQRNLIHLAEECSVKSQHFLDLIEEAERDQEQDLI